MSKFWFSGKNVSKFCVLCQKFVNFFGFLAIIWQKSSKFWFWGQNVSKMCQHLVVSCRHGNTEAYLDETEQLAVAGQGNSWPQLERTAVIATPSKSNSLLQSVAICGFRWRFRTGKWQKRVGKSSNEMLELSLMNGTHALAIALAESCSNGQLNRT